MLTHLTLTGADDSVCPFDLDKITKGYPFAEWGILFSKSKHGLPRYPTKNWLNRLYLLNCSAHICGEYARQILLGKFKLNLSIFNRVQLNIANILDEYRLETIKDLVLCNLKEIERSAPGHWNQDTFIQPTFIIQSKTLENPLAKYLKSNRLKVAVLLDNSGGEGKEIEELPKPLSDYPCGYAGGLNVQNLESKIEKIAKYKQETWVDMESSLRDGKDFSLKKCVEILKMAEKFFKE